VRRITKLLVVGTLVLAVSLGCALVVRHRHETAMRRDQRRRQLAACLAVIAPPAIDLMPEERNGVLTGRTRHVSHFDDARVTAVVRCHDRWGDR